MKLRRRSCAADKTCAAVARQASPVAGAGRRSLHSMAAGGSRAAAHQSARSPLYPARANSDCQSLPTACTLPSDGLQQPSPGCSAPTPTLLTVRLMHMYLPPCRILHPFDPPLPASPPQPQRHGLAAATTRLCLAATTLQPQRPHQCRTCMAKQPHSHACCPMPSGSARTMCGTRPGRGRRVPCP